MMRSSRVLCVPFLFAAAVTLCACQSPTDSDDTYDVDDFIDSSVNPLPATAATCTDGKNYRVVRGNNQPDDILNYDWKVSFAVTVIINSVATSDDVDIAFPVELTSISVKEEQASNGVVTPPTGGEVEHYDSLCTSTSATKFSAVGNAITVAYDVWYDNPNLSKEALITVSLSFKDDDGLTFTKNVEVRVNP